MNLCVPKKEKEVTLADESWRENCDDRYSFYILDDEGGRENSDGSY